MKNRLDKVCSKTNFQNRSVIVKGSCVHSLIPICQLFLYSLFPDFFEVIRYFFHIPFKFLDGLSSVSFLH